ncbi:TIR domain-containing protein [Candidatus Albibeggiatoa sp. nov. BB20]|uniref:WD40 domain-containing protein n=1 Tax=Candidatus Albibeggiatoa sp. nov. BB20 TaxID=3162723 RepID=UPI00336578DC
MNAAFISYSRKNKPFVQKLADAFKKADCKIWIDWEGIPHGSDWWNEIEAGIETANAFVFIITPESLKSDVCARELEHALKHNKKLVPILRQDVTGKLPYPLAKLDWIFFRDDQDDFDKSFCELLDTLNTDLDLVKTHTRLLTRALDWENHNFNNSYLLRGEDLRNARKWLASPLDGAPKPTELHSRYIATSSELESKNQRLTITAIVIGFLFAVLLAIYANNQRLDAEEQRHVAMINGMEAMSYLSEAYLATNQELDALYYSVSALEDLDRLKIQRHSHDIDQKIKGLDKKIEERAEKAINQTQERNRLELHVKQVQTVAFTPKNNYLLSGSSDDTVKLWTIQGKKLREFKHKKSVYGLAVASDESFFASASADKTVKLWSLSIGDNPNNIEEEPLQVLEHTAKVNAVDISRDNQRIATVSSDGGIRIWSKEGQLLSKKMQTSPILAVKFSHNGKYFATAGSDRTVSLWDAETIERISQFKTHKDRIHALDFSHDDQTLISASADNTLCFWKITDSLPSVVTQPDYLLEAHDNWVYDVRYNPNKDMEMLASASANGEVKLWSIDGTLLRNFAGSSARTTALSFSHDGQWLASAGGDNIVRLYDMKAGESVKVLEGHTSGLKDVDFSPQNIENPIIASSGTDGSIRIWDSTTYRLINTIRLRDKQGKKVNVRDVDFVPTDFAPDGSLYIAASTYNNTVEFYDLNNIKKSISELSTEEIPEPNCSLLEHDGKIKSIAFNPHAPLLATTYSKKIKLRQYELQPVKSESIRLRQYNLQINPCQLDLLPIELEGHKSSVLAISFSPDGRTLASGSSDGSARLWLFDERYRYTQQSIKLKGDNGHIDWVNNLGFSPNGKYLATAGSDNLIKLWNVETGQFVTNFIDPALELEKPTMTASHRDWVWDVSFAPNTLGKQYLVSGGADNLVKVWTYPEAKLVTTLTGHKGWVRSVGFSPNNKEVVSGSADKKVILWDLKKIMRYKKPKNLLKTGCDLLKDYLMNKRQYGKSSKERSNTICEKGGN